MSPVTSDECNFFDSGIVIYWYPGGTRYHTNSIIHHTSYNRRGQVSVRRSEPKHYYTRVHGVNLLLYPHVEVCDVLVIFFFTVQYGMVPAVVVP